MSDAGDHHQYEVAVVGGGPAGMSAALYSTRLGHRTALVDRGGGRAAMTQDVHNMITSCSRDGGTITLSGNGDSYEAEVVVLATGFDDVRPDPPLPRTGSGLHYCLHCDAHMFVDQPVYVMGDGESAAHVAGIMLNFTDEVDLLLRGDDPAATRPQRHSPPIRSKSSTRR
jgi:thioredoxin reductase (NADPH)